MDAVFSIAASGFQVAETRMAVAAHNVANTGAPRAEGEPAFQPAEVVAASREPFGGSDVAGIVPSGDAAKFDLAGPLVSVMLSQRHAQANLAVMARAEEAYRSMLDLA